jgi:hypothetical protein
MYVSKKHKFILNIVVAKKMHASLGNPKEVDDEGFLMDVDVQTIDEDPPSREDKRCDVDHFFKSPVEKKDAKGMVKKYCTCKLCPYVSHSSVICSLMRYVLTETKRAL